MTLTRDILGWIRKQQSFLHFIPFIYIHIAISTITPIPTSIHSSIHESTLTPPWSRQYVGKHTYSFHIYVRAARGPVQSVRPHRPSKSHQMRQDLNKSSTPTHLEGCRWKRSPTALHSTPLHDLQSWRGALVIFNSLSTTPNPTSSFSTSTHSR